MGIGGGGGGGGQGGRVVGREINFISSSFFFSRQTLG